MKTTDNSKNNILELAILSSVTIFSLIFWESPLAYPIKIFIVLLHEINHAIMTILTGGSVESIKFTMNLSGVTITKGGHLISIASAGYLGSLFIGAMLFLASERLKLQKWISNILASILLIVSVNLINGGFQIFLGLIIALIFIIVPRVMSERVNYYFFRILGLVSCLYIIVDIKQDLLTTSLRETDTQFLEYLTGVPAFLIGGTWFIISLFFVYLLIKKSYFKKN